MAPQCMWEPAARARLAGSGTSSWLPAFLTAFFPAYNDAATIGTLIDYTDRILAALGIDYEIIVVNDGSGDDTAAVLAAAQIRTPRLRVITNPGNTGYGAALRAGFAAARGDFLFYTDGDGQYDPTELLSLLPHGEAADLVNGYKIRRGDGIYRAVLGRAYAAVARAMFGLRVRDVDCDFRLIRRSLLQQLPLTSVSGSICAELMYQLQAHGARVVEVPVEHYPRVAGRSQFLRPQRVLRSLAHLARLWCRLRLPRGRRQADLARVAARPTQP